MILRLNILVSMAAVTDDTG